MILGFKGLIEPLLCDSQKLPANLIEGPLNISWVTALGLIIYFSFSYEIERT